MLWSIALLIFYTVDPNRCAFVFTEACLLVEQGYGQSIWFITIFVIVGPLYGALLCFGIELCLNHVVTALIRSKSDKER